MKLVNLPFTGDNADRDHSKTYTDQGAEKSQNSNPGNLASIFTTKVQFQEKTRSLFISCIV